MSIQDIGAIGELTAALATILTLLYLARQIQQGSKSIKGANLSTMVDAMSAMHETHMQIADFFDPEDTTRDVTNVADAETWAIHGHCVQMYLGFETAFLFHLNGTIDDEYFESRMNTVKRIGTMPYFRRWWDAWASDLFDRRYIDYVEQMWGEADV